MPETWGELVCGHRLKLDDPDQDVTVSEFCSACGSYSSFVAFFPSPSDSRGTEP